MPRLYKLEESGYDGVVHDPAETGEKTAQAIAKSNEWDSRIPIGIFYQNEHVPTYQERITARIPNYMKSPPALQEIADGKGNPITNIDRLLGDLKVES
jgi:2-oxoglutarate ferredoxin oxidoreductase subunit beta